MITEFAGPFRWLSNFWLVPVAFEGLVYPSLEHAYVAAKTLDQQVREEIRRLPTPAQAKRYGRRFGRTLPLRPAWDDEFKSRLMARLLREKFTNPELRQRLISTGNEPLIESNRWHDNWFGSCHCPRCGGRGKNMLGTLLMELRKEFREQEEGKNAEREGRLADAA
jgi:ribA/ribD-fused uncharacterized protein